MTYRIPFNKPFIAGRELDYISQAVRQGHIGGDGPFTRKAQQLLQDLLGARHVFLTTSCTDALELAAILVGLEPGDEVILPSYTFASTANAFLLRGARLVFVDCRPDTLNIDETQIEQAITGRTRAIVPVHYAGVACEMDAILSLAARFQVPVIEDAAQAVGSKYKGRCLGTLGSIGAYSFHETKNVTCGEGGAIVLERDADVERTEVVRERGTNRTRFVRGQLDKYTWVDIGSSFLPSDIVAAFLVAQLECMQAITARRAHICDLYRTNLQSLDDRGHLRLPSIPAGCETNSHMFYIVLNSLDERTRLINHLAARGIQAVFHYVPLHTSPMGAAMGYRPGMLPITEDLSDRILRLPLYAEMSDLDVTSVTSEVHRFLDGSD